MFGKAVIFLFVSGLVYILLMPDQMISGTVEKLGGDYPYELKAVDAPVATGFMLDLIATAMTKTRFGPFLRRLVVNDIGVHKLRDLASQIDLPPLHFPMHRLSAKDWNRHHDMSNIDKSSVKNALTRGVTSHVKTTRQRTSMEYHRAYLSGQTKPSKVMKKLLDTISQWETDDKEKFKVFSSVLPDEVMKKALESDARYAAKAPLSVLDGVPVAIKDMIDVENHVIFNGKTPKSKDRGFSHTALKDDTIAARFREVGAIILGVTVMTEGGTSPLGYNVHFKGPVNPYSASHYSGGSSSGSAVAVATGLVPIAIGFDGGGSIRIPATMSGVHGLAASFGRIAFDNATASTMIKAGPFGVSSADVALAYAVISPAKPGHFYSELYDGYNGQGPPSPHLTDYSEISDLAGVKIGVFPEWFTDADPQVVKQSQLALEYYVSRGAELVNITIPHLQTLSLAHSMKICSEFAMGWDLMYSNGIDLIEPQTNIVIGVGTTVTAKEILAAEHIRAWTFKYFQEELFQKLNVNVIITPTTGVLVPPLTNAAKERGESNSPLILQIMKYIFLGNFLGLPGYSVPIGYSTPMEDGVSLPMGLQLLGNHWNEHLLIRMAHSLESGFQDFHKQPISDPKLLRSVDSLLI